MDLLGAVWVDKKYKNNLYDSEFEIFLTIKPFIQHFHLTTEIKHILVDKRDASIDFCFSILQLNTRQGKI